MPNSVVLKRRRERNISLNVNKKTSNEAQIFLRLYRINVILRHGKHFSNTSHAMFDKVIIKGAGRKLNSAIYAVIIHQSCSEFMYSIIIVIITAVAPINHWAFVGWIRKLEKRNGIVTRPESSCMPGPLFSLPLLRIPKQSNEERFLRTLTCCRTFKSVNPFNYSARTIHEQPPKISAECLK